MNRRWIATCSWFAAALTLAVFFGPGCERDTYEEGSEEASEDGASQSAGNSDSYRLRVPEEPLAIGEATTVDLEVIPGPDLKVNREFGWKFNFDETSGVEMTSRNLRMGDMEVSDDGVIIPLEITADEAGRHTVSGLADFSVCNDEICPILIDEPIEFTLNAQ